MCWPSEMRGPRRTAACLSRNHRPQQWPAGKTRSGTCHSDSTAAVRIVPGANHFHPAPPARAYCRASTGGVLGLHLVAGIGTLGHRLSTDDGVRGVDIFCSAFALRSVNHRSRSLLRRSLILDATMGPQSVWSKTISRTETRARPQSDKQTGRVRPQWLRFGQR